MDALARVVVVGTGLIGTSIALALRDRGVTVLVTDQDAASVRLAEELGAGTPLSDSDVAQPADLAVLAVPSGAVATTLLQAQHTGLAHAYTDVGSVKGQPLAQAETFGCDLSTFVGGHPLAGRERSGPAAARSDLFQGRPWVLCPSARPAAEERALAAATALVRTCGAEPILLDPVAHDRAVALVSHVPHVVASAAAARLQEADAVALSLAGQGLRDTTRIAAGDADLWAGILNANAEPVADVLDALITDLGELSAELRGAKGKDDVAEGVPGVDEGNMADGGVVADLLRRGCEGRARVPGKRGGPAPAYTIVPVVISDQPGQLGRLFDAAGAAGVNVEDVALEHSPGLPVGVVELSVRPEHADRLTARLREDGWSVHS